MGDNIVVWGATSKQIDTYYLFVFLAFIYMVIKHRKHFFTLFIILIFFNGLMGYIGKNVQDIYRIFVTLFAIIWLIKTKAFNLTRNNSFILISFVLFSFFFIFSALHNNDYFSIIFSQYSRYFILFVLFLILLKYKNDNLVKKKLEILITELLIVQILLSLIKFLIMGPTESIVGSIASQGGAMATSLPILGFIFLWLKKKGVLKRNDWLFLVGLLFIGFESGKRAIWFIMPAILTAFMFYVPKKRMHVRIFLLSVIIVPLVFYMGVRLIPSLNKQHRIWGSFDLNYAYNFAEDYSLGTKENAIKPKGRTAATMFLFDKIINTNLLERDWFGYGLRFMYATNYDEFSALNLDVTHKGSVTGVFQTMISNGYLGIIAILLFSLSIIFKTRNKRLRYVLLVFFLWEYIFYTGIIIREPSLSFLLIYIIVFSDSEFKNRIIVDGKQYLESKHVIEYKLQ